MLVEYVLRKATCEDEEFLEKLYATSRDFDLAHAPWSDSQKRAFLDSQGRLQRDHYRKFFPNSEQQIIVVTDAPVGRLYVDRTEDEIHLMDVCLLPEYRNRGIGQSILEELVSESVASDLRIWCTVSLLNHGSRKFFARNGFRVIRENGPNVELERLPYPREGKTP